MARYSGSSAEWEVWGAWGQGRVRKGHGGRAGQGQEGRGTKGHLQGWGGGGMRAGQGQKGCGTRGSRDGCACVRRADRIEAQRGREHRAETFGTRGVGLKLEPRLQGVWDSSCSPQYNFKGLHAERVCGECGPDRRVEAAVQRRVVAHPRSARRPPRRAKGRHEPCGCLRHPAPRQRLHHLHTSQRVNRANRVSGLRVQGPGQGKQERVIGLRAG